MTLADMLLSPLLMGISLVLCLGLWMWTGISGEWHDRISKEHAPWLRSWARQPRLVWLRAGLVAFFFDFLLYMLVR